MLAYKVKTREFDLFAAQQAGEILLKLRDIKGSDILEVDCPVRPGLELIAVEIVIVQRDEDRGFAVHAQLCAETVRARGLSAAGRAGDQDGPCAARDNLIR
ncbi:hypothetical protein SDC9_168978 [bioreactor metagenome]|uniref:Uncharacterized protein n=1 Tax=bioreactor metagenome TaxID=1076179 RepID=A0A645G410_9ZZZZ